MAGVCHSPGDLRDRETCTDVQCVTLFAFANKS